MLKLSKNKIKDFLNKEDFLKYDFDIILSIQNGGDFIGETISEITNKPLLKILIQRNDRKGIYKKIEKYNKFLAHIIYELFFIFDKPKVLSILNLPKNTKVLIVDDAIHTGKTIKVLENYLKKFNFENMDYFFFTKIGKHKYNSVFNEKIIFPWSENYNKK